MGLTLIQTEGRDAGEESPHRGSTDFEEFVVVRGKGLLRFAYLLTSGSRPDAEDLVQIALEKAYRHWRRVDADRARNPADRDGDPAHRVMSWKSGPGAPCAPGPIDVVRQLASASSLPIRLTPSARSSSPSAYDIRK